MAELESFDNPTGFDAPPNVNQPGSDFVTSEGGFGYEGIPRLKSDEDYEKVKPGGTFYDPTGAKREKPHVVKNDIDFAEVPEGEMFQAPDGSVRRKPKYEPVDFTANTLYHMAVNDKERRKALERSYPGKVRGEKAEDFYVEDDGGVLRKPKGFSEAPGSFVAGIAAPTVGSAAGGIFGGASGGAAGALVGAPTGPGLVGTAATGATAGAVGGAAIGGMGGQAFNDIVMQLAGVFDRSTSEEVAVLGWSAVAGGAGEGAGRAVAAAVPSAKGLLQQYLPKVVAKLLGAEPEAVATATRLADQGVLVPPSAWAKEAPHVQNITEVLDPAFRTQKPLQQSAEAHYEKTARHLLEDMGMEVEGSIIRPAAAVSTKEAGEALLSRAVRESQEADAAFAESLKPKLEVVAGKAGALQEGRKDVLTAAKDARQAAQNLLDQGYQDIEHTIEAGMKVAKAGSNSGDLWWGVGEKLQALRAGVMARHSKWYSQADEAAGGVLPDTRDLPERATQLLSKLPEGFEGQYPGIVQRIRDLAGVPKKDKLGNVIEGEWVKEPQNPTFGQLHDLRSVLRNQIDWWKLNSDFKNGSLKHLQNGVNDILHDPGAAEELKIAAKLLDATDRSYAESMSIFNSKQLNAVMKGMEAGVPADEGTLPISQLGSSPQVLLVNAKVPAKTVPEFVAYAKAQPAPLAYGGGGGPGSASNLIMALFLNRADLKMTSVAYRGTAPALTDVIAGVIPVTFVPISEAVAQATNPAIRILAVSSGTRSARLPDVPSVAATYPGYNAVSWTGMLAPNGTPKAIIDKLAGEMARAAKDPKFIDLLRDNGIDPAIEGPEKFAALIAAEIPNWAKAVEIAGVKIDQ